MQPTCFSKRSLLARTAALVLLSGVSLAANALEVKPFTPESLAAAQAAGQPVAVHFHADWCPTCRQQQAALGQLKQDAALKNVTVLVANFDTERELRRTMNVRGQSTLVVFKGSQERARLAGQTDATSIGNALRTAL